MYTIEEKSYIQFMGKKFRDKWCEVNIGPDVMQDYIAWCKKQGPLSQEMFAVVSRATCVVQLYQDGGDHRRVSGSEHS